MLATPPKLYAVHETNLKANDSGENSKVIEINVDRNGNQISISHNEKNATILTADVEYVFLENNNRISMLKTYDVTNNTFTIESKIIDLKVWRLKLEINGITYVHMTTKNNTIGSVENVERRGFVEIETVASKTIDTGMYVNPVLTNDFPDREVKLIYFEFYFQFDKKHDKVVSINVEYVFGTMFRGNFVATENVDELIVPDGVELTGYRVQRSPELSNMPNKNIEQKIAVRGLDENFISDIDANYVARVFPIRNMEQNFERRGNSDANINYGVKNFAIVRIQYIVDGVFFNDPVINNPWDPSLPEEQKPVDPLSWLQELIAKIKEIIQKLKDAWGKYSTIILTILYALAAYIAFRIIKACWGLIQLPFKLLKVLFIPRKK